MNRTVRNTPPASDGPQAAASPATDAPLSRRHLFAGAGAAGALAAAAAVLPGARSVAPAGADAAAPTAEPAEGGYRLTEHVQRYYDTARV